jgi:hypothetical protein
VSQAAERLTGMAGQMNLFVDPQKERNKNLDSATVRINEKYGNRTIRRGRTE